jgi:hypothetical protein
MIFYYSHNSSFYIIIGFDVVVISVDVVVIGVDVVVKIIII